MRREYVIGAAGLAFWLASCASQPVEAQLATACNQAATAVREAAILRANGKLSPQAIAAVGAVIPTLEEACDTDNPPADMTTAVANVLAAVQTVTLQNAGVR